MGRGILCILALVLYSLPAAAAPEFFGFVDGYIDATANRTDDPTTLLFDERIDLDGDFFIFDDVAVSIDDFRATAPQTPVFTLSSPYGGFDMVVIESLILTPGTSYTSSGVALSATEFSLNSGPIRVQAVYNASNSISGATSGPQSLDFETNTLSSTVDTDLVIFELTGLTLGFLPGAQFGESADLIVKGDLTFIGVVPEPSTASLVGLGLAGLAWRRRRLGRC